MQATRPDSRATDTDNNDEDSFTGWDLDMQRYSYPAIVIIEEMCRTLVVLAFDRKRLAPGTRFRDLSLEQQLVLTMLLNCSLAWHCSGSFRDARTEQWIAAITCVADLNTLGLPPGFRGTQQQDDLRAFIEQDETVGEGMARHRRQMKEALQRRKADRQ